MKRILLLLLFLAGCNNHSTECFSLAYDYVAVPERPAFLYKCCKIMTPDQDTQRSCISSLVEAGQTISKKGQKPKAEAED